MDEQRKEMIAYEKIEIGYLFMGFYVLLLAAGISWADSAGRRLPRLKVGGEAPWFTLPSSQDRLVDYGQRLFREIPSGHDVFPGGLHPGLNGGDGGAQ